MEAELFPRPILGAGQPELSKGFCWKLEQPALSLFPKEWFIRAGASVFNFQLPPFKPASSFIRRGGHIGKMPKLGALPFAARGLLGLSPAGAPRPGGGVARSSRASSAAVVPCILNVITSTRLPLYPACAPEMPSGA